MGLVEMNCRFIEDHLEEILAGDISPATMLMVKNHLAECNTCRQLIGIAECRLNPWPDDAAPDLTREVLEKTSGATCERARTQLCDWLDRRLEQEDGELLGFHLEHCAACRNLTATLRELKDDLPTMAEVTPDPDFCLSVLKATVAQQSRRIRAVKWWETLFQRPRFAWEAAYLGTLVIFGFLGVIPVSKATKDLSAMEILSKQPVAFLESINWSVSTEGVLQSQFASGLTHSVDVWTSAARREASSSLDGVRHMTRQVWITGFATSSEGVGRLRKKAAEYLQKVRSPQHNSPQANPS